MKHTITLFAVLLMALAIPQSVCALTFSAAVPSGQTLNFSTSGNNATVRQSSGVAGNLVIPTSITYNGVTYSVINIYNYAFENCSELTSVTIPNSVTTIVT